MRHNTAKLLQDVLDVAIVWDVPQHDLPQLRERVRTMLAEMEGGP